MFFVVERGKTMFIVHIDLYDILTSNIQRDALQIQGLYQNVEFLRELLDKIHVNVIIIGYVLIWGG